jgi:hypothetical protein
MSNSATPGGQAGDARRPRASRFRRCVPLDAVPKVIRGIQSAEQAQYVRGSLPLRLSEAATSLANWAAPLDVQRLARVAAASPSGGSNSSHVVGVGG